MSQKRTVFSIHGIRTRGAWQKEKLTKVLSEEGFVHVPLDYGPFSALRLVVPWLRRKQIKWFRDKYTEYAGGEPPPCIIAHSFGTYLVARSMEIHREICFDRVILCGSIVRTDYPWSKRVSEGQCNTVLHDYGHMDWCARAARYIMEDAGPSGADGFSDEANGKIVQREHREFRHSDYFYELNYKKNWIPFLLGKEPQSLTADDRQPINWRCRLVWLVVVMAAVAISCWLAPIAWRWSIHIFETASDNRSPIVQFPRDFAGRVPIRETVLALPPVEADGVVFTYRNSTNDDLKLLLFSCYVYYNAGDPPREPWSERELPSQSEKYITQFNKPSGWFLFYVRKKSMTNWHYLGRYDLFSFKRPLLIISKGSGPEPYQAGFSAITE